MNENEISPETVFDFPAEGKSLEGVSGFVYIIRAGEYYKIGRTQNPEARFQELQIGNPNPIMPICLIPSIEPEETEKALHERYSHCAVKGEWFMLSPQEDWELHCHPQNILTARPTLDIDRLDRMNHEWRKLVLGSRVSLFFKALDDASHYWLEASISFLRFMAGFLIMTFSLIVVAAILAAFLTALF